METTKIICEFILSTSGSLWGYRSQINIGEIFEDSIVQTKTKDDIISEIVMSIRNDVKKFPMLLEILSKLQLFISDEEFEDIAIKSLMANLEGSLHSVYICDHHHNGMDESEDHIEHDHSSACPN
tara:strand:+ start:347 stop:721 length:375 start_codon:yes stop_codon:yes gene_type:complete